MKPVTVKDVARLQAGLIDDPVEALRVSAAIGKALHLAAAAELLSLGSEDDEDRDLPDLGEFKLPNLSRTRLARMSSAPNWATFAEGARFETKLSLPDGDELQEVDLVLTRQGDSVEVQAELPCGLQPVGLVLAQFDFGEHRTPCTKPIRLPDVRPLQASDQELSSGGQLRQRRFYDAAAAAAPKADSSDQPQSAETSPFDAKQDGKTLTVTASVPDEFDNETLAADVEYQAEGRGPQTITRLVQLNRLPGFRRAVGKISDFPWPIDFAAREATLTIRPLTQADVPRLTNHQVTTLMANQRRFAAVPLSPGNAGRWQGELRYEFQQAAAADPQTTWLVRLSEEGGVA